MEKLVSHQKIVVLDFGSQYTQLIARRVREIGVFSEIQPFDAPVESFADGSLIGIILSGGPASVLEDGAPMIGHDVFELGVPVLGLCYGMQLIAKLSGGRIERSRTREYGRAIVTVNSENPLFMEIPEKSTVWMSHGDHVGALPDGFEQIAETETLPIAGIADMSRRIFALQFHPEVNHTQHGVQILKNFAYNICGARGDWNIESFIDGQIADIRARVGDGESVVLGYSGGVDSTVTAALLDRALGQNFYPVFVDNGLMRLYEAEQVAEDFAEHFTHELISVDATDEFLGALDGVTDPERKRKIIGAKFIDVFTDTVSHIPNVKFLAQGTLYPDVIESVSTKGPSVTIKSHHNVGGLPEKLDFELIEPLRWLFKDEVRALGEALGLPRYMLWRHPFPGPGLAVRILGEITRERLDVLRKADDIFIRSLKDSGEYDNVWQAFAVLLPVQTVGVMGDERTYENVIALRAVDSKDAMTADWSRLPLELLARVSSKIINEVAGINRVCYDISSKPPATIEWE
ncbi:MAG TPA: glutamine-hydrolyzing GMP synthase [candidate division Zixibacteria bacterium]|nr:glutamine-hydrolyzing GMP synthase [candidate division Zixibacteria bacterium]